MHETSIALAILAAAEDAFEKLGNAKRIKRMKLRVGALSLVDVEALKFALKVASRGTPAEDAEIEVELESPEFKCRRCGRTWSIDESRMEELTREHGVKPLVHLHPDIIVEYLECPYCGSRDIEITRGKGVILEYIEVE